MKLSAAEVTQIANLVRLSLSREDTAKYQQQLSAVLGYIAQLNEVDTSDVAPTAQVTGQTNVFREDKVVNKPQTETLLKNAPLREGDFIKVKAVFGDD